jgi:hypothetical protein
MISDCQSQISNWRAERFISGGLDGAASDDRRRPFALNSHGRVVFNPQFAIRDPQST